jgi:hypothetical protein
MALDTPVRPVAVAQRPVTPLSSDAVVSRSKKHVPPGGLTPTRKLIEDIGTAGGILEIDTTDDKTSYRSLVGINRRGMAPDGQEVIMLRGKSYHHIVFRLSSVSDWADGTCGA